MNLTITPVNNGNNFRQNSFKGAVPNESGFFAPFTKKYDSFTSGLAKHFTSKIIDSKPIMYLADKFKDSKHLYQHTLTVGSVITSGLYMQRTYTNDKLDKDRRNTLVVNQGLTLLVSTAGAYLLDRFINGWWEKVTARFAGHLVGDKDFYPDYLKKCDGIKKENDKIKQTIKDGKKSELLEMPKIIDLVKENNLFKKLSQTERDLIKTKINGMRTMKSMIVFGFVYRYFVPVAVTKPANKLCEMYLEHKKQKQQEKQNIKN